MISAYFLAYGHYEWYLLMEFNFSFYIGKKVRACSDSVLLTQKQNFSAPQGDKKIALEFLILQFPPGVGCLWAPSASGLCLRFYSICR